LDHRCPVGDFDFGHFEAKIILKSKNIHSVAILGSGESGMGAVRLAVHNGIRVFLSDKNQIEGSAKTELKKLNVNFEEGNHTFEILKGFEQIVKSPGIPDDTPIILDLIKSGIPVISEIEFAYQFTQAKIIGITGSNGKTTTTLLTAHLLKIAGLNAISAGNVGNSFSQLILDHDPKIVVLELSSFQLDGVVNFKPDIAILLNITPDHLDRYGDDFEKYADAKLRILENMDEQGKLIYNLDDPVISKRLKSKKPKAELFEITTTAKSKNGAYWLENQLIFDSKKGIHLVPEELLPLVGQHNLYNQMAAIMAAILFEVTFKDIIKGLQSFVNAPHRMEQVAEIDQVLFINDTKATNVEAVYYALDAMDRQIVWIAGGINKGNDYALIKNLVKEKVRVMICLGADNAHLIDEFAAEVETVWEVSTAKESVDKALEFARSGEVVLLSPACSSFDLFDNYAQRGDLFKAAVLDAKKELNLKEQKV